MMTGIEPGQTAGQKERDREKERGTHTKLNVTFHRLSFFRSQQKMKRLFFIKVCMSAHSLSHTHTCTPTMHALDETFYEYKSR